MNYGEHYNFYEKLGLKFIKEQHGKGAVHYATYVGQIVLEFYPLKEDSKIEQSRLGFTVDKNTLGKMKDDIISIYEFEGQIVVVVQDPDGRKVELIGEEKC